MNTLIDSLASPSSDVVSNSLLTLRKKYFRARNLDGVKKFRERGGLKSLLDIIGKPNPKSVDVALSILGNCCLEKESRDEVANRETVSSLVTILNSLDLDSILNRTCRTLANLAVDNRTASIIHSEDAVLSIVKFLRSTTNPGSQQTAVRALRILADSTEHRENIILHNGIQAIASLLNSETKEVLTAVVRALAHLTRHCTPECAHQVETNDGITRLVIQAENKDKIIQEASIKTLINLVHQSEIRPVIGNAGAIPLFINWADRLLTGNGGLENPRNFVMALCLSCRESVNRVRVRENGGLKTLISLLISSAQVEMHEEIIAAMLNFLYDERSLDVLLELDMVPLFIDKMATYVKETTDDPGKRCHEPQDPNKLFLSIPSKNDNNWSTTKKSGLKRKESCESDESDARKESKTRQTYRINSPSYQQVQNEILELGIECSSGLLDDNGQWSPTNTIYSPVQSPPEWRQGQYFNSVWQNSPGGLSPDCSGSEDRSPRARRTSEEEWLQMSFSRSPSPSPVNSPTPQYACYSPVCDDLSDQEDPAPEEVVLKEADVETSNSCISAPSDEPEEDVLELFAEPEPDSEMDKTKTNCKLPLFIDKLDPGPNYIHYILMMLSRLSQMEKPHIALLSRKTIETLLAIVIGMRNPLTRAVRILTRLARNPLCFESLITLQFPQQISLKLDDSVLQHPSAECRICGCLRSLKSSILRTLEMQTESPFGIGTIIRLLTAGSQPEKQCAALMLPYLLSVKSLRQKTLLKFNGLDIILDILQEPCHENFKMAAISFSKLCSQMQSTSVIPDLPSVENTGNNSCLYSNTGVEKNVCFVLENDERVSGNRLTLTESSEVFGAMLSGHFKEASQAEVTFGDATKETVEFVMHFLHGCKSSCTSLRSPSDELLFGVAKLADKFLLMRLRDYLHGEFVGKLNAGNAAAMYKFAEMHNYSSVARSVLNCVLGPLFSVDDKVNFLKEILSSSLKMCLLLEIKRRITESLEFGPLYVSM
uniref:BTB domain-containing protein n=1 Tax=Strigamia maritima TaxID=126957 RepID=T1IL44_STRMM